MADCWVEQEWFIDFEDLSLVRNFEDGLCYMMSYNLLI